MAMARRRSLLRQISRDAHYVSRTAGDLDAARRGRLGRRLVRRSVTRRVFRTLGL